MSNDLKFQILWLSALLFEAGVAIGLGVAYRFGKRFRPKLIVMIGAVSPFLLFYGVVVVDHLVRNADSVGTRMGFAPLLLLSSPFYGFALLLGALCAWSPWPVRLPLRFLLGLLLAPLSVFILFLIPTPWIVP